MGIPSGMPMHLSNLLAVEDCLYQPISVVAQLQQEKGRILPQ
jgi:hypothetical protein